LCAATSTRSGRVDLALGQPLAQLVGRQVDQFDRVGHVQQRIGHLLMHGDAGDLAHSVGAALEVLDIDRGVDVDAGLEQLEHILITLEVARAGGVGVGQFVDQHQLRRPRQDGVEVHLLRMAPRYSTLRVAPAPARPAMLRVSARPWVSTHADDDIHPIRLAASWAAQHRVGLAHPRRPCRRRASAGRAVARASWRWIAASSASGSGTMFVPYRLL
jgi:hypothetical protein